MDRRTTYRWLAGAFAALFLLLQGATLAHAAEYGAEHSHDGVVCEAVVLAEDEAAIEPPQPRVTHPVSAPAAPRSIAPYVSPDLTTAPARAPPVRGPPTHSC